MKNKNLLSMFSAIMILQLAACGGGGGSSPDPENPPVTGFPSLTSQPMFDTTAVTAGGQATLNLQFTEDVGSISINMDCTGCSSGVIQVPAGDTSAAIPITVSKMQQTVTAALVTSISLYSDSGLVSTTYIPGSTYLLESNVEDNIGSAWTDTSYLNLSLAIDNTGFPYYIETYCNANGQSESGVNLALYDADAYDAAVTNGTVMHSVYLSLRADNYAAQTLNLPTGRYYLVTTARYLSGYDTDAYNIFVGDVGYNPTKPTCGPTSTTTTLPDVYEDTDDTASGATTLSINSEIANLTTQIYIPSGSVSTVSDEDWFTLTIP